MPKYYSIDQPRTDYEKIQAGQPLYAFQKKKKKKTNLNNTGGLKAPMSQQPKDYSYIDYKTGDKVSLPDVQAGYGGYKTLEQSQDHFEFTKKYNEDEDYRNEVIEDRKHKSGLAGTINSLYKPAKSHLSQALRAVKDDPKQLFLGAMTPAGSKLWNKALDEDFEAQTTWTGGATDKQIAQMEEDGIGTDNFKNMNALADTIAMAYAGGYGANALTGAGTAAGTTGAGTTATGAVNPTGAGFTGTGPGIEIMGGANPYSYNAALSAGGAGSFSNPSSTPSSGNTNSLNSGGSNMSSYANNALIAGSSLGSAYLSHDATEKGIDELQRQYDQSREDMAPWLQSGKKGLRKYEERLNQPIPEFDFDLENDPVYQFQLDEALRATERAMAARGYNQSGNMLRELQDTAIGEAGRYQNDAFNRQLGQSQTNYGREFDRTNQYANLAGLGQSSTNALATMGANNSANLSNLYLQQGQGYNNALQGGIQNYLTYDYLNNRGY